MTSDGTSPANRQGADGTSTTVRDTWDDSDVPSTAVVEAVAAANGTDPMEMPSLYDAIDVDAFDGLLNSDRTGTRGNIAISFTYDGTYVWVDSDGSIEVDPGPANSD